MKAKAEGREIARAEEAPEATNVIDLMQVLQDSLEQVRPAGTTPRRMKPAPARTRAKKLAKKTPPRTARTATRAHGRGGMTKSELRQLSKTELYQRATDQNLPSRSKMNHDQLINALARAGRRKKRRPSHRPHQAEAVVTGPFPPKRQAVERDSRPR